jgi:hypothetical protein
MACNRCGSENQEEFSGEFAASFSGIENINQRPVYVCQRIFICLDCGQTELMVPAAELKRLRESAAVFDSRDHRGLDNSLSA